MILITGASGFLGRHLVQYLSARGKQIRALYNSNPPGAALQQLPGVEWMRADLLDIFDVETAMTGISEVYHCAAIVTFNPKCREQMLHFNPESTANIINQALQQGISKLVHLSSVAAIGRTGESQKEITEEQEWGESKYNSAYGLSKYLSEMEVWRGIAEGLNAVIVNPGIILGAGDWHKGSAQLMAVVNKEFPFYTKGITSWVDVDDVVRILVMLMESPIADERFIVSGGNYAFREIFTLMAKELGKKPPRYHASPLITGVVWRWSGLRRMLLNKHSSITRETANNAHGYSIYNNSKLLKALPEFTYTPIAQTVERMARSFMGL